MNARPHFVYRLLTGMSLVALLLFAGCGKRGPLYLPPDAGKSPDATQQR